MPRLPAHRPDMMTKTVSRPSRGTLSSFNVSHAMIRCSPHEGGQSAVTHPFPPTGLVPPTGFVFGFHVNSDTSSEEARCTPCPTFHWPVCGHRSPPHCVVGMAKIGWGRCIRCSQPPSLPSSGFGVRGQLCVESRGCPRLLSLLIGSSSSADQQKDHGHSGSDEADRADQISPSLFT